MQSAATKTPPAPARLGRVVRGKLSAPLRVILYSTDGLGKSTFASNAPSPIFIGAEDGTAQLDVSRMPDIASWRDIIECVDELANAEHDFKSIVLDTADWAEPLCWEHVAKAANKPTVQDMPYGRGYDAALDQWRLLLSKFERARARGMNIIILAHAVVRTFKNPVADVGDFDRYEMRTHQKASGLLREWADIVLFGNYETFSVTDEKKRTRGISSGARVIHTQRTAAWDAKNRHDLPPTLPLDWPTFADAVAAHQPADPEKLKARIKTLLAQATDQTLIQKVTAAVEAAGSNASLLAKYADTLAARIAIQNEENAHE